MVTLGEAVTKTWRERMAATLASYRRLTATENVVVNISVVDGNLPAAAVAVQNYHDENS